MKIIMRAEEVDEGGYGEYGEEMAEKKFRGREVGRSDFAA
jgi:hypothetical protein